MGAVAIGKGALVPQTAPEVGDGQSSENGWQMTRDVLRNPYDSVKLVCLCYGVLRVHESLIDYPVGQREVCMSTEQPCRPAKLRLSELGVHVCLFVMPSLQLLVSKTR